MEKKSVAIQTPFIKLDSLLKYAGVTISGGEAKTIIEEGIVFVNGEVCLQRGKKIYPGFRVQIKDNIELLVEEKKI